MKNTLKVGDTHTLTFRITREKTVPRLYPESPDWTAMPEVLATGYMVGLMEWACVDALKPHLEPGEGSLGTRVDVTHSAATPPGMTVTVTVRCEEIAGRVVVWRVEARDELDAIGEGRIGRTLVRWDRFRQKLSEKVQAFERLTGEASSLRGSDPPKFIRPVQPRSRAFSERIGLGGFPTDQACD